MNNNALELIAWANKIANYGDTNLTPAEQQAIIWVSLLLEGRNVKWAVVRKENFSE